MLNQHYKLRSSQSSPKIFKKFNLPIIKNSHPQICNRIVNDFKRHLSQQKNTSHDKILKKLGQKNDAMVFKRLKIISLIKGDKNSLSTIPIYENYCSYSHRRKAQTVFNKNRNAQQNKNQLNFVHKKPRRSKTQVEQNLVVSKANMHINLKILDKILLVKKQKQTPSLRQISSNKRSLTEQVNWDHCPSHRTKIDTNQCLFVTNPNLNVSANNNILNRECKTLRKNLQDYYEDEQQIQQMQIKKCPIKLSKYSIKSKFRTQNNEVMPDNPKQQLFRHYENVIMNQSIRGWTRYVKHEYSNHENLNSINSQYQQ